MSTQDPKFQPTRWTQVSQLRSENPRASAEAAEYLFSIYWYPLYVYALRKWTLGEDAAKDLVQSFMLKLHQQETFQKADKSKSKLRTYLITAFNAHVNDDFRKHYAQKRGGGAPHQNIDESFDVKEENESDLGVAYDIAWAKRVMEQSYKQLEAYLGTNEESSILLKLCKSKLDYASAAEVLEVKPATLRTRVSRLRQRLSLIIREEISQTLAECQKEDLEEEFKYLLSLLKKQ